MTETWVENLMESPENQRLLAQEDAILQVTELVCRLMEEQGISKVELARMMGTSAANITQVLDGRRNMTIRTISDLLFNLNHVPEIQAIPKFYSQKKMQHSNVRSVIVQVPNEQSLWRIHSMPDGFRDVKSTKNLSERLAG